jgi:hypothetical protein
LVQQKSGAGGKIEHELRVAGLWAKRRGEKRGVGWGCGFREGTFSTN